MKYSTIYKKAYKQTEAKNRIHTYIYLLFHIEVSNIQQYLLISRTKELAVTYSSEYHQNPISKSKKTPFLSPPTPKHSHGMETSANHLVGFSKSSLHLQCTNITQQSTFFKTLLPYPAM
ncbi:hypothetical protein V6Z11_A03G046000 [Gossypium hirsutum]